MAPVHTDEVVAKTEPDAEVERSLALLDEREWTARAVCAGRQKWFFDPYRETENQRARREAIASMFCQACPVILECRDYARAHYEHGFWGGESEEDRTRAGFMPRSTGRRSVLEARREMNASS